MYGLMSWMTRSMSDAHDQVGATHFLGRLPGDSSTNYKRFRSGNSSFHKPAKYVIPVSLCGVHDAPNRDQFVALHCQPTLNVCVHQLVPRLMEARLQQVV